MNIRIKENALTPDIYEIVRKAANFQWYGKADARIALKNSLFTLVAYEGENPVGIGRIVGDNRISFLIKDVVVLPEYRHQKIGQLMMERLLQYIDYNACPHPYVVLMASKDTEDFYDKFGFICRPNQELGHGMIRIY